MKTARCFYTLAASVILGACATAPPPAAAPSPSLSKIDARSMPEDDLKEVVLAQLGEILTEYPRPADGKKPKYPLTDLWYWTTPRSGQWANICRYQNVRMLFSSDSPTEKGADAKVRVAGLDLDDRYFLTGEVERDRYVEGDRERRKLDRACATRIPLSQNVFSAESDDQIVTVVGWLKNMNEMTDEEFSRLDVSCDIRADSALSNCAVIVKNLKAPAIASIRNCTPANQDIREPYCLEAEFDSISVAFEAKAGDALPLKIVARELIYFADQRID